MGAVIVLEHDAEELDAQVLGRPGVQGEARHPGLLVAQGVVGVVVEAVDPGALAGRELAAERTGQLLAEDRAGDIA